MVYYFSVTITVKQSIPSNSSKDKGNAEALGYCFIRHHYISVN
jgi:hypothetical protein